MYDADADALYVGIRKGVVARTESLDDWTMVDVDATGAALGIEVIHPARAWPLAEFLDRYRIEGPNRRLLEDLFPPATGRRRAAFSARDTDVESDGEPARLAFAL